MKRIVAAVFAIIAISAAAIPAFAADPSDIDLRTSAGVEKFYSPERQASP